MYITLQGFGDYKIEEHKYNDFMRILNLDVDLLLHLIDLSKIVIPILCINSEFILEEGPQPSGHLTTEIGMKRLTELLDEEIIIYLHK
jgi:hypothetical protein